MKSKLTAVVASMVVLGLVSCPGYAAQAKHRKHDYKGEGAFQPVSMESCPRMDMYTIIMDGMTQSYGRAKPTEGCNKLISFAGGINFDAHTGNLSQGYVGENSERFSLNDAYLNIFGIVNDWTRAFMVMSYNNAGNGDTNGTRVPRENGAYGNPYSAPNTLNLEQGYITFGNFNQNPVFVQVGKKFQDYGRYMIHPIQRTLTQVLTETNRTSANIGFIVPMGVHGQLMMFDNPLRKATDGHSRYIYGASLGWDVLSDQLGWDMGIGYMSNMTGVTDVGVALAATPGFFTGAVGAIALYGDLNSGPFDVGIRYTTALQHFSAVDLLNKANGATGAKPWAADIKAGYGFNAWNKNQNLYVGYQASRDTSGLNMPSSRWMAGYGVNMWRNANIGLEIARDVGYSVPEGGTGMNVNEVGLRAAVQFG